MKNYVITIARGFGSGGLATGMQLSRDLGIPCYERQILTMAAEQSGIREENFCKFDEKLKGNYLTNMLRSIPYNGIAEPTKYGFVSDVDLFSYSIGNYKKNWQEHNPASLLASAPILYLRILIML